MTYAINGFRYLIAGGNLAFMQDDLARLLVFLLSFGVLTLGYLEVRHPLEFNAKNDGSSAQLAARDRRSVRPRQT